MRSLAIVKTGRESSSAFSPVLTIERLQMAQDTFHVPGASRRDRRAARQSADRRRRRRHAGRRRARRRVTRGAPAACAFWASIATPMHEPRLASGSPPTRDRVRIVDADLRRPRGRSARGAGDFIGSDRVVGVVMDLGVSSHQLDDALARLLLPRRRPARHAHGPDAGRDRRTVPRPRRRARARAASCAQHGEQPLRRVHRQVDPRRRPRRRRANSPRRSSEPFPPRRVGGATWRRASSKPCASR